MFSKMSLFDIHDGVMTGKFSCQDVVRFCIERAKALENLNAFIEIFDDALDRAKEQDERLLRGERLGALAGVPIAIKDNILYKGKKMSCASKFLKDFVAPYSATIVQKLLQEDAIIIGRTNMDEFAMGGSCEHSAYGPCHNAWDFAKVSGGSSGGSAVAVAAGIVPCAIGTDTGGSIRQPSSFNGVVGVKPTYGRVSRYGIVAFASSLDQASPICKTARECQFVLDIISGKDEHDATSIEKSFKTAPAKRLGVIREVMDKLKTLPEEKFSSALKKLEGEFELVEVSIPHITSALACYYIIAPAEATSNLARFDGVKYTSRVDSLTLDQVYIQSRTAGFGDEVKRRITLGNFVLSSGYFDAYYNKAKQVQRLIKSEFNEALKLCDALILPTTAGEAFEIGQKSGDPLSMYMEDLFTVPANIASLPAISVPYALGKNGLPLGLQVMASAGGEGVMFEVAEKLESIFHFALEKKGDSYARF